MSNTTTDQKLAESIAVRATQRRTAFENRVKEAEIIKNEGNDSFKAGDYETAAKSYWAAIERNFTEPNYYSNLAAALIKIEDYDGAEKFASMALSLDPCHLKARYRRLQARKAMEMYDSALCDAEALLRIDNNCQEAHVEIKELQSLRELRSPSWEGTDDGDDMPNEKEYQSKQFDPEEWTDSEDSGHTGNDVPCRYYNHQGCFRGTACAFSHAQDDLSVRDRLGKNVCVFFILGICKFGDAKCNYSHSKAALPPVGWWTDPEEIAAKALEMEILGKTGVLKARISKPGALPPLQLQSMAGKRPGKGKSKQKKTHKGKGNSRATPRWCYDDEEEMFERMDNCGFTDDDVMELLSHGVKPWDSDAGDVLGTLYDFY